MAFQVIQTFPYRPPVILSHSLPIVSHHGHDDDDDDVGNEDDGKVPDCVCLCQLLVAAKGRGGSHSLCVTVSTQIFPIPSLFSPIPSLSPQACS